MRGFPIQRSPDQRLFANSPEHIAGCHVFHRLWTPRHPPCTLTSLTTSMNRCHRNTRAGPGFHRRQPHIHGKSLPRSAKSPSALFSDPLTARASRRRPSSNRRTKELVILSITRPFYSIVKDRRTHRTRKLIVPGTRLVRPWTSRRGPQPTSLSRLRLTTPVLQQLPSRHHPYQTGENHRQPEHIPKVRRPSQPPRINSASTLRAVVFLFARGRHRRPAFRLPSFPHPHGADRTRTGNP